MLFGVGTGDVADAFNRQYREMNSSLSEEWRLRAHNQYLTFLISFGLIGFLLVMTSLVFPVFKEKGISNIRFLVFIAIILISMMNEDTFETSAGAMFASFFYALFLFGTKNESNGK